MTIVRLLGAPTILHDGEAQAVRGKKTWALLARIVLTPEPIARRQLAFEIFPEADDPLGALRWSLSQARRSIRSPEALQGDPVRACLDDDVTVDALVPGLTRDDTLDIEGGLLDGIEGDWSPDFDLWLTVERRRWEGILTAAAHHDAEIALARDDLGRAVRASQQLVRRAPLDESAHIMLVQALARTGDQSAAADAIASFERIAHDELGATPTEALRAAVAVPSDRARGPVSTGASIRSLLESGEAALDAGAIDAGVVCMRQAVADVDATVDPQLAATAWCSLGSALVHAVRGSDDEGRVALRRAADLALEIGDNATAVTSLTELGYADLLAGRRVQAEKNFTHALDLADGLDSEEDPRPGILGFSALNLADWGKEEASIERVEQAIGGARAAGLVRPLIFALTFRGRICVDGGDHDGAIACLDEALDLIARERWLSFRPLARSLHHEAMLHLGEDPAVVRAEAEETYSHSCQLGDPCWQATGARAIALTWAHERPDDAYTWLAEARRCAAAVNDTWAWVDGASLDTEIRIAHQAGEGDREIAGARQLLDHATARQLGTFVANAVAVLGRTVG